MGGEAAAEEALRRQMVLWSPAEGEEDGLSPESGAQPDMADMTPESGEAAEREPLATWLLLDLREGASVRFLPVSRSPQEESLRWPEPGELEEALAHWRDWPAPKRDRKRWRNSGDNTGPSPENTICLFWLRRRRGGPIPNASNELDETNPCGRKILYS